MAVGHGKGDGLIDRIYNGMALSLVTSKTCMLAAPKL